MSATARAIPADDGGVYARLYREGHAPVLRLLARDFPRVERAELEDAASAALTEMLRAGRIVRWSSGAIGQWYELSRRRVIDHVRKSSRWNSDVVEIDSLTSGEASAHDAMEARLNDWRAIEVVASLSDRAATYVRLRVLEGRRRADVREAAGWTKKQYERAQEEARRSLRSALVDLDETAACRRFRNMIDSEILREISLRHRLALRAHRERCASCRAYASEAQRTIHGIAPIVGLIAPAGTGGAVAMASVGVGGGISGGLLTKGLATVCVGALCAGGIVEIAQKHDSTRSPKPTSDLPARAVPAEAPTVDPGSAVVRPVTNSRSLGASASIDPGALLGLDPVFGTPHRDGSRSPEVAFGLHADHPASRPRKRSGPAAAPASAPNVPGSTTSARAPQPAAPQARPRPAPPSRIAPATAPSCVPGELGC